MPKPVIAFLFGGSSAEHDVSIKSATEIAAAVDTDTYEPVYIGITRDGSWRLFDTPGPIGDGGDRPLAVVSPDRGTHGLLVIDGDGVRTIALDAVFPVLHGTTGEDGAIQGLLELSGIPYVGCDIAGSAICIDKSLAYLVAGTAGIATPGFSIVSLADAAPEGLTYPVFVKPARSGSSFGVQKVERRDGLDAAIAEARQFDSKVLIEEAISGSEIGCAVFGDGIDLSTGELDQITLQSGFFRIHQEATPEQGSENSFFTVPAPISDEDTARVKETAKAIYAALGCRGLARVDMFLQADGRIVLNEVNTLPGFTSYSRYPRMMAAAGIPLGDLVSRSIALTLAR